MRLVSIGALGAVMACGVSEQPVELAEEDAGSEGSISVAVTYQDCPRIDSLSVSPDEMPVGSPYPIALAVGVKVPGAATPTYSWSAPSGSFGDAGAPVTTFECTAPGIITVSCTVSNDGCQDKLSVPVVCAPSDGGEL